MIQLFGKQPERGHVSRNGMRPANQQQAVVDDLPSEPEPASSLDIDPIRCLPCRLSLKERVFVDEDGPGKEKLRLLKHRLLHLRQSRELRVLIVTSAVPREGKTAVATNLALTLARTSARVLLIDGDMRKPGLHRLLCVRPTSGLSDCLAGLSDLASSLYLLQRYGLYVLTSGLPVTNPTDLLQNPQLRDLFQFKARSFEWVVVDSPPLLPFADAHCLAAAADAAILVARAGLTRRSELERAVQSISGVHIAGTVLNACKPSDEDSYYEHYAVKSAREDGVGRDA